jgi:antitoxin component YwqK of YwqJK toxin-antitoxin module
MKYLFQIIFLSACLALSGQSKKHVFESKTFRVEYHTKNGLLDGKYISHYANGNKKAEGNFKDNRRTGKWEIWDTTGKIHREHLVAADSAKRNVSGYFDYAFMKKADVVVEKTIWRNISKENNPLLFSSPSLFDTLYDLIRKNTLTIYKDEALQTAKSGNDVANVFASGKYEVASFKLKEDWFFDKKTNASEIRPVALYAILRPHDAESEDNIGLGWIYFPDLRKIFATQKVSDKHFPSLTSLDDLFWYRHFSSQIFKETNVYDRPIASYAKTPEEAAKEAERVEIDLLEMEHEIWLYGKSPFSELPK